MANRVATECPKGHPTLTPESRDSQGYCRQCRRDRRTAQRAALDVVDVFVTAGVRFENDGVPVEPSEVVAQLIRLYDTGKYNNTIGLSAA